MAFGVVVGVLLGICIGRSCGPHHEHDGPAAGASARRLQQTTTTMCTCSGHHALSQRAAPPPAVHASRNGLFAPLHLAFLEDGSLVVPNGTQRAFVEIGCSDRDSTHALAQLTHLNRAASSRGRMIGCSHRRWVQLRADMFTRTTCLSLSVLCYTARIRRVALLCVPMRMATDTPTRIASTDHLRRALCAVYIALDDDHRCGLHTRLSPP